MTIHRPETPDALLYQLANDRNARLRADAAWSLGMHGGPSVVAGLLAAMFQPDQDTQVLMAVIASLDRIRDRSALEPLRRFAEATGPATYWEEQCRAAAEVAANRIASAK